MLEKIALFTASWNVAWRKKGEKTILNDQETPFVVKKNSFRYWAADPFLFEHEGQIYIFAELYDYIECHGCLGYCKWDGNKFSRWKKVITEPYHLSYPFIFEQDGQVYIMPESNADKSVYLYCAVQFPDKWIRVEAIRENVKYCDTTPFLWNNHAYALSYDIKNIDDYNLVLLDLENKDNDCVLCDIDNKNLRRPAGKIFQMNDMCIRPAQKSVDDYGEGLLFYKYSIETGEYSEEVIKQILPQDLKYSKKILLNGMHTYNQMGEFEVIDLKTRRFSVLNFVVRILYKIKRSFFTLLYR